jgi:hypothetical protein
VDLVVTLEVLEERLYAATKVLEPVAQSLKTALHRIMRTLLVTLPNP